MKFACRKCGCKGAANTPELFKQVHCGCGYVYRVYTADFRVFDFWRDMFLQNFFLPFNLLACPWCRDTVNLGNTSHLNSDGSIVVPIVCPHCHNPLRALQEMDENQELQAERERQSQIDELLREAQYDAEPADKTTNRDLIEYNNWVQSGKQIEAQYYAEREERRTSLQVDPRDELTNLFANKDWMGLAHNQYYLTKHSKSFTAQKQKLIDYLHKNKDKYKPEEYASAIRNLENAIRSANVK